MESCQAERYLGHYVTTNVCAKELLHTSYVTYHAPLAGLGECSILCWWVQLHARHPLVGFHGIHIACFQQAIIGNTTNVGHLMAHEIEPQGLCLHNINNIIKGFGGGKFATTSMSSSDKVSLHLEAIVLIKRCTLPYGNLITHCSSSTRNLKPIVTFHNSLDVVRAIVYYMRIILFQFWDSMFKGALRMCTVNFLTSNCKVL